MGLCIVLRGDMTLSSCTERWDQSHAAALADFSVAIAPKCMKCATVQLQLTDTRSGRFEKGASMIVQNNRRGNIYVYTNYGRKIIIQIKK